MSLGYGNIGSCDRESWRAQDARTARENEARAAYNSTALGKEESCLAAEKAALRAQEDALQKRLMSLFGSKFKLLGKPAPKNSEAVKGVLARVKNDARFLEARDARAQILAREREVDARLSEIWKEKMAGSGK